MAMLHCSNWTSASRTSATGSEGRALGVTGDEDVVLDGVGAVDVAGPVGVGVVEASGLVGVVDALAD